MLAKNQYVTAKNIVQMWAMQNYPTLIKLPAVFGQQRLMKEEKTPGSQTEDESEESNSEGHTSSEQGTKSMKRKKAEPSTLGNVFSMKTDQLLLPFKCFNLSKI